MDAMSALALVFCGYSLITALVLTCTHFRRETYRDAPRARVMGLLFVAALAALQLAHFAYLWAEQTWWLMAWYRCTLFIVAPAAFLFSRALLVVHAKSERNRQDLAHALPAFFAPLLSPELALLAAFSVGAVYLLALARYLWQLRASRANFQVEFALLAGVFVVAILVAGLCVLQTWTMAARFAFFSQTDFFALYSTAIGGGFFFVQLALGLRPQLSQEVHETAQTIQTSQSNYANSTLKQVDCAAMLQQLAELMQEQQLYTDPDLSLADLAAALGLSSHQVSELLNARLGKGFSRYLREQRIAAAKIMLCKEPTASVLSIGLSVGFAAQSSFYEAFREIEGMTPGQYRKLSVSASC